MNRQTISSNRIKVTVGNSIFEIPQEKTQQLINMLQSWQSVAIPEQHNSSPFIQYNGQSLICG